MEYGFSKTFKNGMLYTAIVLGVGMSVGRCTAPTPYLCNYEILISTQNKGYVKKVIVGDCETIIDMPMPQSKKSVNIEEMVKDVMLL